MVVIKLQLDNEIRRVTFSQQPPSLSELVQLAQNYFFQGAATPVVFKYKDEEEDLITISLDRELEEALNLNGKDSILKLFVVKKEVPKEGNPNSTHSITSIPFPP